MQVAAAAGIEVTPCGRTSSPRAVDPADPVPMRRFYARIALTGDAPAEIRVQNIGDKPVSASTVKVAKPSGIAVVKAAYDGTELAVAARSDFGGPVTAEGYGALELNPASGLYEGTFPSSAPARRPPPSSTAPRGPAACPSRSRAGPRAPGRIRSCVRIRLSSRWPSPAPATWDRRAGRRGERPASWLLRTPTAATGISRGSSVGLDGSASTGARRTRGELQRFAGDDTGARR